MVKTLTTLAAAIIVAAGLAGCGRRGALLPPPDPNAPPQAEEAKGTDVKGQIPKRPKNRPILPPQQPFILDPLL